MVRGFISFSVSFRGMLQTFQASKPKHCRLCDREIDRFGLWVMGFCSTSCKNIYLVSKAEAESRPIQEKAEIAMAGYPDDY